MISLIVAMTRSGVIGVNNTLPWSIPEDLKRFRAITLGSPIIMGRKTYDSIGKPLPKRTNIVVSRNPELVIDGCICVTNLAAAILEAQKTNPKEIFIIGGSQIFQEAIDKNLLNKFYITWVEENISGDVVFPKIDWQQWQEVAREKRQTDLGLSFSFCDYLKKVPNSSY